MSIARSAAGVHCRPGPQPWNQLGSLRTQLALARTPRPTPRERVVARLLDLLRDDIADIATDVSLTVYQELHG
jgi:hypothetical protein